MVVPFKGRGHKSRLSRVLDRAERKELSLLMLGDVLEAVAGAGLGESCCVVSSDLEALKLAHGKGMIPVQEGKDRGVNAAVRMGMRMTEGPELMVVPADLPLLSRSELEKAVSLKSEAADIVIAPSEAFDGTNLLLFSRATPVRLNYDADSFWNHLEGAARRGYSLAVYAGRGVVFDVDSVGDLRKLARARGGGASAAFAREALKRWDCS